MEDPNPQEQLVGDAEDLPIGRRGLDIAALLQQAGTGAQGRPVPNYAADAANANTRVAQLLERSLRNMEQDKGYSRIGTALAADVASQGKVPYGQTVSTMEGQELGRATNVATAMAGLARSGQADELRLANLLQRRTEALAREGNMKAQRVGELVRGAAGGFDDPALASAHMYGYLARKQKENPNLDLNELPAMMNEAILDARKAGLARKRSGGGGTGGGAAVADDLKGIPLKPDGTPDFTKQIARASTEWARTWNASPPEVREKMWQTRVSKAIGEGGTGGGVTITSPDGTTYTFNAGTPAGKGAQDKQITTMNENLAAADSVSFLIDNIKSELSQAGASSIGTLGRISLITGALKAQVNAALSSMREGTASEKQQASTLVRMLENVDQTWSSATGRVPKAAWLTGDNSESAQRIRTNIILLAYAHSKAMDPGGRIARDDVENTMRAIGETGGDPVALNAALTQLFSQMKNRIESNWMRSRGEEIEYVPNKPIRRRGEAARTPGEGSPQEQRPQGMSDADWQELQDLRRAQ